MILRLLLPLLAALFATSGTFADTMECPNGILDTAEIDPPTREVVRRRCGEPDLERAEGYQWVYHTSQFSYVLQFNNKGEVVDIQRSHRR